jgi:hypothetical protein
VGVWDTVGAMGIPLTDLDKVDQRYEFHDTGLSKIVKNAYHALSIDETRPEFIPTLWTSKPKPGQTVEQMWFAGVHSEVGGGKKPSLTNVPLRWMQDKAQENGLEFDPKQIANIDKEKFINARVTNHFKPLSRNFYPLWAWINKKRPHVRPIGGTQIESVHDLVFEKISAPGNSYKPTNDGLMPANIYTGDDGSHA